MKKIVRKSLCVLLSLVITLYVTATAAPTGYLDSENTIPIAQKELKYFDNESDWSTPPDSPAPIPDGIDLYNRGGNGSVGDLQIDSVTKVNGLFGRENEDAAFKLAGTGGTRARELGASLLRVNYAKGDNTPSGGNPEYANFTSGRITAYFDIATTTTEASGIYKGVRTTFYANSSSAQYAELLNFTSDGNIVIYNAGEGDVASYTVPYETNKWYTVAVELEGNSLFYNAWIDGVKVTLAETFGNRMQRNNVCTAFRDLYIGMQVSPGVYNDLYLDNMAVYFDEPYSEERYSVIKDAASISLERDILNGNTDSDNVLTELSLPTIGNYGSEISWESSDPSVIGTDGKVSHVDSPTNVTLTATVSKGDKTEKKSFVVTVPEFTGYDDQDVDADMQSLTFDVIKGSNAYAAGIVSNLVLPTTGSEGSTITWSSSDESAISLQGEVNRTTVSRRVTLTALIENGDASRTKTFDLVVLGDVLMSDPLLTQETMYDNVVEHSDGLTFSSDGKWSAYGVKGIRCQSVQQTGQYVVYDAMPGAEFSALVARYSGCSEFTFATAGKDKVWKTFSAVSKKTGVSLGEGVYETGGWNGWVYTSTQPLPEGTRYLRINIGAGNSTAGAAMLSRVDITGYGGNYGNDIILDDIIGKNASADSITEDINIYPMWGVAWEISHPDIIAENGVVTRPASDTVVTLTANINTPDVQCKKTFTLKVKGK